MKIDLTIFGWPHDDSDDNIDDDGMRVREANQNDDLTSLLDVFLIKWARHIGWHLFEIWNSNFYGFFEIFFLLFITHNSHLSCVCHSTMACIQFCIYFLPCLPPHFFFLYAWQLLHLPQLCCCCCLSLSNHCATSTHRSFSS